MEREGERERDREREREREIAGRQHRKVLHTDGSQGFVCVSAAPNRTTLIQLARGMAAPDRKKQAGGLS